MIIAGAVELKNSLQTLFEIQLSSTVVFDYPTAADIAQFIHQKMEQQTAPLITISSAERTVPALCDIQAIVGRAVVSCTGEENVGLDAPLMSIGLDSLSAVELRTELGRSLNVSLPSTLAFDYPTIKSISEFIRAQLGSAAVQPASAVLHRQISDLQQPHQMVSIDRVVHRLPATAPDYNTIVNPLEDTCGAVPFSRWDVDDASAAVSHRPGSRFGRFLHDVDLFDAKVFAVSPVEAALIDPQQRLMLEGSYEALNEISSASTTTNVAVLASISFWDYSVQADRHFVGVGDAYKATGRCFSVAAGRISFCYGLKGPAISIDTACSSSLSAVHLGRRMIHEGRCANGLVTAALLTLDPATIGMLTAASMLAPDGRCKTLDASADGYVRGEACVTLLLTSGDSPFAVVAGSAINQDGRSSSLTAPNGPSQQDVLRLAQSDAHMAPYDVSILEMHGTGTPLGDPIEVGAAAAVFGAQQRHHCLEFSAAKSHMGHAEPAAGAVGIQRAISYLQCDATVGTLHLTRVNPYVVGALESAPNAFGWMPRSASSVAHGSNSCAGISGFAFQGTNAHLIVGKAAVEASLKKGDVDAVAPPAWERSLHWFTPPSRMLARHARASNGCAISECDISAPALSYLWQHQVNGRSILPGTAMFEAMHASTAVILGHAKAALIGTSLQAPLLLQDMAQRNHVILRSRVFLSGGSGGGAGAVELESGKELHAVTRNVVRVPAVHAFVEYEGDIFVPSKVFTLIKAAKSISTGLASLHIELTSTSFAVHPYGAHPALNDASTHLGALYDIQMGDMPRVPVQLGCFKTSGAVVSSVWAHASTSQILSNGNRQTTFGMSYNDARLQHLLSKQLGRSAAKGEALYAMYSQSEEVVSVAHHHTPTSALAVAVDASTYTQNVAAVKLGAAQSALRAFTTGCSLLQTLLPLSTKAGRKIDVDAPLLTTSEIVLSGDHQMCIGAASLNGVCAVAATEATHWKINFDAGHSVGGAHFQPSIQLAGLVTPKQLKLELKGTTVITGGLSGLGMLTATWLAASASAPAALLLLGRTGRVQDSGDYDQLKNTTNVNVCMQKCDIATMEGSSTLSCSTAQNSISAIIHAAGVLADNLIAKQGLRDAFTVFSPKMQGATSLVRESRCHPVMAVQMFTSVSSSLGNPGQANYAAANSALDASIQALHTIGVGGTSIQWGPWAHSGMAALADKNLLARLERGGMTALLPSQGLSTIAALLFGIAGLPAATLLAGAFTWSKLLEGHRGKQVAFAGLISSSFASSSSSPSAAVLMMAPAKAHMQPAPSTDQSSLLLQIEERVLATVASVIGGAIDLTAPLMEAGMDSLGAVELRNTLATTFKTDIPATIVFDYPSVKQIAGFIASKQEMVARHAEQGGGSASSFYGGSSRISSAAAHPDRMDIKKKVLGLVAQVLGNDDVSESQPFMEVRKFDYFIVLFYSA